MRGYTREDVDTHNDGGVSGPYYPAVNVKVYGCSLDLSPIMVKYACTEKKAQEALNIAWECACEDFWNVDVMEVAEDYFGERAKYYSAGRGGGWLVVEGLGFPGEWDGVQLNRWAMFERAINRCVAFRSADESLLDAIDANLWAGPIAAYKGAISAISYGHAVA